MIYRVVHGRHTGEKAKEGWYVEKSEDGKGAQIVSRIFDIWLEAKAAADKLSGSG